MSTYARVAIPGDERRRPTLRQEIIECVGRIPEDVAKEKGGTLIDFHSSRADAEWALASDPSGRVAIGWEYF